MIKHKALTAMEEQTNMQLDQIRKQIELLALQARAEAAGLINALIQDAGLTEFGGVPTYTAVAIGPDRADRVDAITGQLPLL
jgi:peptidyl-tRNA hydrolase